MEIERLYENIEDQKNLKINLNSKVFNIEEENNQYLIEFNKDGVIEKEVFDIIIIAGGGMFRLDDPSSEEEIYQLPIQLGHTITNLSPSLSSLIIKNNPLGAFSGISINAELTDLKTKEKMSGDLLITHGGLSGPLPLDFSSILEGNTAELNFSPNTQDEEFVRKFNSLRQGKNLLKTFLKNFLPSRLAEWHISEAGMSEGTIIADVNKDKLKILRKNLFHFELSGIKKLDYQFSWTTKGGVDLSEININTMESKLHKNIYFAGEILDVNGLCGGYNISFSAISAKITSEYINKR